MRNHAHLAYLLLPKVLAETLDFDLYPYNVTSLQDRFKSQPEIEETKLAWTTNSNIPSWLIGEYYNIGPGLFEVGETSYNNFFDGLGAVSKFNFSANREVSFTRKLIKSRAYEWNMEAGKIVVTEPGTYGEPDDIFDGLKKRGDFLEKGLRRVNYFEAHTTDNSNVVAHNVYGHLLTMTEQPGMNIVDQKSLETVLHLDIREAANFPKGFKLFSQTAHGFMDNGNKNFYNQMTGWYVFPGDTIPSVSYITYRVPNVDEYREPTSELFLKDVTFGEPFVIDRSGIQYYHQGLITDNYFILPFNSMEIAPTAAMPIHLMRGEPPLNAIKFNENTPGMFVVIDKVSLNEVARFASEEFHSLHTLNAYESPDDENIIYFDTLRFYRNCFEAFLFPVMNVTDEDLLDNYDTMMVHPKPTRITLDLSLKNSNEEDLNVEKDNEIPVPLKATISDEIFATAKDNQKWPAYMANGLDFPSLRPSQIGRYYDEFFSGGEDSFLVGRIYKSKYSTMERWVWHEVGYHCAQSAVVERPDDHETIEGESVTDMVVVTVCTPYSDETGKPFFVVLDENMVELGRAYLPVGVKIPATLHTTYISRYSGQSGENSSFSLSLSFMVIFLCNWFAQ